MHPVDLVQEAFRIADEVLVPGIAGPAQAFAVVVAGAAGGLRPGLVPVHVDDHHVDGQLPLAELPPEGEELLVRIGPVAAPPVAEDVLRGQGNLAGDLREVREGGLVVMSVGEQVPVLHFAFRTRRDPFPPVGVLLHDQVAGAFIDQGPAVAGQDAGLHRVAVVDMVGTRAAVQGAGRAHEVPGRVHAGFPGAVFPLHPEGDGEVVRRELPAAAVGQLQGARLDADRRPAAGDGEFRDGEVPVHDGEGGVVLEGAVSGPFHPDQAVRQDREAGVAHGHLRLGACDRIVFGLEQAAGREAGQKKEETFHLVSYYARKNTKKNGRNRGAPVIFDAFPVRNYQS